MLAEDDGKVPLKAVFHSLRSVAHRVVGPYVDSPDGVRLVVDTGQEATVASAINDIVIFGVHGDVGRFSPGGLLPILVVDGAAIASVLDSDGGIVLLCGINTIGEGIVGRDPIELRGRLVVIGTPSFPTIVGNLCPAVITDNHTLGVFRGDPEVVMVAMGRIEGIEGFAPVGGLMVAYVQYVDHILILGVGIYPGVVPGPLA